MIIAVTGGAGQLGTVVIRRLLADRKVKQVRCIDVRPPFIASVRLRTVIADVRDPDIGRHFEGCDAVIHLAFIVMKAPSPAEYESVNLEGSKNVFAASVAAGVRTIVYSSSVAAYGVLPGHPVPIVESSPRRLQREHPYAACKWHVENFLDGFEAEHPDVAIARLRPAVLIGEHMDHPFGEMLKRGKLVDAGARAPFPVVWDEDVADAAALALARRARGAFNLVADDLVPLAEFARLGGLDTMRVNKRVAAGLARASYVAARILQRPAIDPAWFTTSDTEMTFSCERAKTELGWRPRCPTARDVINHFVATVPRRMDRRLASLFRLAAIVARHTPAGEAANLRARIHFAIGGPAGGDLSMVLEGGPLQITRGLPSAPTAVVRVPADAVLAMLTGKLDSGTAQLTGRILVEGEQSHAAIVGAVVGGIRDRIKHLPPIALDWLAASPTPVQEN
jgi:UDP-glucose 4-epimerase